MVLFSELRWFCFQKGEGSSDPSHTGRWNSLELVKGSFGPDDCINDIAEIKFDRPLPITVSGARCRFSAVKVSFAGGGGK